MFIRWFVLTLSAAAALTAPVADLGAEKARAVDAVFADYDSTRSPGCALGVIRDGAFIYSRGYGMADLERGIALSPNSVFRIGSTSKQFSAAVMVLLQQDGKLSLGDDIRRFLPEIPQYERTITIRHLLNHTSGIRDYLTLFDLAGYREDDWYDEQDLLEMLARQRDLNFLPGDEFLYSNSGYFLLSQLALKASGESMRDSAERRIFKPLQMSWTHFHDDHTEIVPRRAMGYSPRREGGFRLSMTTLEMVGDGGIFTTVEDLLKWDTNFYQPRVGGQVLLDSLHTRGRLNNGEEIDYALGLTHGEYRGLKTVSHGGSFVGFRAEMLRFPRHKTSIICLCNLSATNPTALARQVADVVLAGQLGPPAEAGERRGIANGPTTRQPSAEERRAYAGDYYSEELEHTYRLIDRNGALHLEVGNSLDSDLGVVETDLLAARRLRLRFSRESQAVTGFELDAGRVKNLKFRKVR